jgi:ribose transport system permease protein
VKKDTGDAKLNFPKFLDKFGSLIAFGLLILLFSVISEHFRSGANYLNILVQSAPLLIIALGVTFVNMAGESDLSLGGIIGVAASLFCGLVKTGSSPLLAFAAALAIAALFGLLNGLLVAYANLSSFIVTISIMFLSMGVEMLYAKGQSLWIRDHPILNIVNGSVLQIPNLVIISAVIFILTYFLLHQTRLGVHVQAVGESREAAKFAGIPIKRLKLLMFVLGSAFYAVGGILNALRSSGSIIYSGQKLLLPALAITFVGKTILGAKKPNVPGILVGAVMLSSINNAFTLLGVEFYFSLIVQGLVLLAAAALSAGNRGAILQEDLR